MATVLVQRRNRNKGVTYPIYYKDPLTGEKRYYKTLPRFREARRAANDLRVLLDAGKLPDSRERKLRLMTLRQMSDLLKSEWDQEKARP